MEIERRAGGKLFHARGPATENARSPMDARRVDGTTRCCAISYIRLLLDDSMLKARQHKYITKLTKFTTVDRKLRMFTIFYGNVHYTAALVKY